MEAMRLSAMCQWSPALVALSVVFAVGISFVALLLTFYFRGDLSAWSWLKISSAVVMGAAIPIMHYTGMAAATFYRRHASSGPFRHGPRRERLFAEHCGNHCRYVSGPGNRGRNIAGWPAIFPCKRWKLEASAHLVAIVESSDDAIISKTLEGDILTWNSGAERMFGYSAQEAQGKKMMMLIPSDRSDEEPDILARIARGEKSGASRNAAEAERRKTH